MGNPNTDINFVTLVEKLSTAPRRDMAVLLIDMQTYFYPGFPKETIDTLVANQVKVLRLCRQEGFPVVSVEYHDDWAQQDETDLKLKAELENIPWHAYFRKYESDAFSSGVLTRALETILTRKRSLTMGIEASGCIRASWNGGKSSGFELYTSPGLIANKSNTNYGWFMENGVVGDFRQILA